MKIALNPWFLFRGGAYGTINFVCLIFDVIDRSMSSATNGRKKLFAGGIFLVLGLAIFNIISNTMFEINGVKQLNTIKAKEHKHKLVERNNNRSSSTALVPNNISRNKNTKHDYHQAENTQYHESLKDQRSTAHLSTASPNAQRSAACNPSFLDQNRQIDRIFFAHMRKAGGTTLKHYFKKVAKEYGLSFRATEGIPPEMPYSNSTTFYVTHLREPISRLLSTYKYEGRWKCPKVPHILVHNSTSLEGFIEAFKTNGTKDKAIFIRNKKKTKLWRCAQNCYIRWLSSNPRNIKDMKQSYSESYERLSKYNLIIITEKLKDPTYIHKIEQMFNVGGMKKRRIFCESTMKELNAKYPPIIKNSTLDNAKKLNRMDITLYREFTSCVDNTTHFPRFDAKAFRIGNKK